MDIGDFKRAALEHGYEEVEVVLFDAHNQVGLCAKKGEQRRAVRAALPCTPEELVASLDDWFASKGVAA